MTRTKKPPTLKALRALAKRKGADLKPIAKWLQVYEVTFSVVRPATFIYPSKHYRKGEAMRRAYDALSALPDKATK